MLGEYGTQRRTADIQPLGSSGKSSNIFKMVRSTIIRLARESLGPKAGVASACQISVLDWASYSSIAEVNSVDTVGWKHRSHGSSPGCSYSSRATKSQRLQFLNCS